MIETLTCFTLSMDAPNAASYKNLDAHLQVVYKQNKTGADNSMRLHLGNPRLQSRSIAEKDEKEMTGKEFSQCWLTVAAKNMVADTVVAPVVFFAIWNHEHNLSC
jgi:hypothetical protein